MSKKVKPGLYRHFKGHDSDVLMEAKHTETLEELVVYEHLETGEIWVRPKKMFLEKVVVDGKKVPRFKYIGNVSGRWERANLKAEKDFQKGDFKTFDSVKGLIKELHKHKK